MTTVEQWGAHWHGLAGAGVIKTEAMLRAGRCIASVLEHQGILHVYGPSGSGKTFATAHGLRGCERPAVYALFDGQANPREMASVLLREATGCQHQGTRFTLRDECVTTFTTPTVLIIDEAQHLQRDCLYFLRYIHDHPVTRVTIIMLGDLESRERVKRNATLASRTRRCPFQPVKLDVLLRAIPCYHPIFSSLGPGEIQRIHDRYAAGDLRRWAEFALTSVDECARRGVPGLDARTVNSVLAELAPPDA